MYVCQDGKFVPTPELGVKHKKALVERLELMRKIYFRESII